MRSASFIGGCVATAATAASLQASPVGAFAIPAFVSSGAPSLANCRSCSSTSPSSSALPRAGSSRGSPRQQTRGWGKAERSVGVARMSSTDIESPFATPGVADMGEGEEDDDAPLTLTLENVETVLDEMRPYLMSDGGNVRVVEIDGPVVRLELEGACGSCPSSTMTMKMGLERRLVQRIPEISEVVQSIPDGPELNVENVEKVLDGVRPFLSVAGGSIKIQSLTGVSSIQPVVTLKMTGSSASLKSIRMEIMQRIQREFMMSSLRAWTLGRYRGGGNRSGDRLGGRPAPRRRYPPPRAGYIYVVQEGQSAPRAVRAEEASFIIRRVTVASFRTAEGGTVQFEVQVTMNDGYKYGVLRRYSQFDQLRERVAPVVRTVCPPFPPKNKIRSATVGLQQADLEERRTMLQAWLQSLCTAASTNTAALRVPLYDFLETAAYYPPDEPFTTTTTTTTQHNYSAGATAVATPTSASDGVPYATATPYAEALPTAAQGGGAAGSAPPNLPPEVPRMAKPDSSASDGWAIPLESREASDLKLAMTGPDASGRLTGAQAAEALRAGTGAGAEDLRAVWELSDIDRDGMLDRDEFAVAWYLAHQAAAGNRPPSSLPADVVPPSKRQAATRSSANPF
eukprot:g6023.t1